MRKDKPLFDEFYEKHFAMVRSSCGFNPHSRMLIDCLKEKGYRLVLATNPLFPATATMQRVRWAGLEPEDFALITTYENSWHCKPFPAYYQDILTQLELRPEQCMMVGNDVRDDMVAAQLGMQTYLLTDCLINQKNADISVYQHGSMERLLAFVQENM